MPGNRIWQPIVRHGRPPICGVYMQGSIKKERKGLHKEYRGDGEFIAKRHEANAKRVRGNRRAITAGDVGYADKRNLVMGK